MTSDEVRLLSLGLNFCLPITKIKFHTYFLAFEKLVFALRTFDACYIDFKNFSSKIKFVAIKYYYKFRPTKAFSKILSYLIQKSDFTILKKLENDTSVSSYYYRSDKGRGIVILNRKDYIDKINNILSDISRFKAINTDRVKLSLKLDDKMNRFERKMLNEKKLSDEESEEVYSRVYSPAILYSLPKTHKPNLLILSILSAFKTQ